MPKLMPNCEHVGCGDYPHTEEREAARGDEEWCYEFTRDDLAVNVPSANDPLWSVAWSNGERIGEGATNKLMWADARNRLSSSAGPKCEVNALFTPFAFAWLMQRELDANAPVKGDWATWRPDRKQIIDELILHQQKLAVALLTCNPAAVTEHAADVGNACMKAVEMFGTRPLDSMLHPLGNTDPALRAQLKQACSTYTSTVP